MVLEDLLVHAGGVVIGLQGHHPGGHFGDGNLRAPVAQGGGRIQTHQAGAHDKHPLALAEGLVNLQRVAEIPEAEDVGGLPEMGDGGDEEPGAGGNEQLVVRDAVVLAVIDQLGFGVDPADGLAGDMEDVLLLEEILPHEVDALDGPLMPQELVEHTAGVDVLVDGNDGNGIAGTELPEDLGGADAGGSRADDDKSLHGHTSLTSMAFLGQARTQAGPSSRCWQKSHFTIRVRSGVMAGTP